MVDRWRRPLAPPGQRGRGAPAPGAQRRRSSRRRCACPGGDAVQRVYGVAAPGKPDRRRGREPVAGSVRGRVRRAGRGARRGRAARTRRSTTRSCCRGSARRRAGPAPRRRPVQMPVVTGRAADRAVPRRPVTVPAGSRSRSCTRWRTARRLRMAVTHAKTCARRSTSAAWPTPSARPPAGGGSSIAGCRCSCPTGRSRPGSRAARAEVAAAGPVAAARPQRWSRRSRTGASTTRPAAAWRRLGAVSAAGPRSAPAPTSWAALDRSRRRRRAARRAPAACWSTTRRDGGRPVGLCVDHPDGVAGPTGRGAQRAGGRRACSPTPSAGTATGPRSSGTRRRARPCAIPGLDPELAVRRADGRDPPGSRPGGRVNAHRTGF